MKFTLFPQNLPRPPHWTKILSWIIITFGMGILILGIVVRDQVPAVAQNTQNQEVIQQASAQSAQVGMDTGIAQENAENPAQTQNMLAATEPSVPNNPTDTASPKTENDQLDLQSMAQRYQMTKTGEMSSHQALIERKKAEDTSSIFSRIMSIVGIFGFIGIAWLFSNNKKRVLWKLVAIGTGIQLVFAIFILWTPVGKAIFAWLNDAFTVLINFTQAGVNFLFASYSSGTVESALGNTAMSILPPIIFFSSLMTVLYHIGFMQWIVRGMAKFMMKFMGTSGAESLSSVANIFVGMTEAPLVVKPYVAKMTHSELFAVMSGGMATVAGGVMASYVAMLQPFFPDIAGHLIAASVMSAPASLVVAKIMIPETETPETMGKCQFDKVSNDANVIDAAARGASEGMQLAINVGAMLLAFIALIALINFILGLPSRMVNAHTYNHVAGYVVSAGGQTDPACKDIYSTSDTIVCTHGALVTLAGLKNIEINEGLKVLSGDQSHQIEQTEELYDLVLAGLNGQNPSTNSAMIEDCQNDHNIAACGAVIAKTQQDTWTPSLEKKSLWPLLSLEAIFGFIFFPFAFLMGVPLSDCYLVGQLLGEKMAINEFVAYLHLSQVLDKLSYRAIVISTYALCGFANFGSIAIQIGGIGGMAPNRRSDIAKLGIKAMIAGSIAAFMTATIAGALV